ncbi:RNA-binding cell elongation regulator Jag/EloR [Kurthia huakuii]|uniref:RNA-binding cell elongation regulator Jag/EloR n=1 Tax=Kurthia huakuii TaxID=1421019 RepID=UPI000498502A|nr:RNA-binding cell elongation regulator Jag/EloR [Kurthia huakuii]MBM7700734.1 spoIIIJ-associated protein [Kurthia huakuii]
MKQATQIGKTVDEAIDLALKQLNLSYAQVDISILQQPKKGFLGIGAKKARVLVTEKELSPTPIVDKPQDVVDSVDESPDISTDSVDNVDNTSEKSESFPQPVDNSVDNSQPEPEIVAPAKKRRDNSDAIAAAEDYLRAIASGMGIDDLTMDVEEKKGKLLLINLKSDKAALLIGKRGQTLNSLQQLTQLLIYKHTNHFLMVELDVENYRERREESLVDFANNMADKAVRTRKAVVLEPMPSAERKVVHHALSKRLDVDTFSEGENNRRHLVIEPVL